MIFMSSDKLTCGDCGLTISADDPHYCITDKQEKEKFEYLKSDNDIGEIKRYIPLDQRRPDPTPKIQRSVMAILLIFGIIAVSTMFIYIHEVWALENPELGDDRNIGIHYNGFTFYISYFKSIDYEIIQMYDCNSDGTVQLGTTLHKSIGDDVAYHFIIDLPERETVGKSFVSIVNDLVDYCRDNPSNSINGMIMT